MDGQAYQSQVDFFQQNPWAAGLLGVTPLGSRYLGALGSVEGWRRQKQYQDRIQQLMEAQEERERRQQALDAELGALAGIDLMAPDAESRLQAFQPQFPQSYEPRARALEAVRKRRGVQVGLEAAVDPGAPLVVEEEMGRPGSLRGFAPPTRIESARGAAVSVPRSDEAETVRAHLEQFPPATGTGERATDLDRFLPPPREAWMGREPVEREVPGAPQYRTAAESMTVTQPARPPAWRPLPEALARLQGSPYVAEAEPVVRGYATRMQPEATRVGWEERRDEAYQQALTAVRALPETEQPAALAKLAQTFPHAASALRPPTTAVPPTTLSRLDTLQGQLEQVVKTLPPDVQAKVALPAAAAMAAIDASRADPRLLDNAFALTNQVFNAVRSTEGDARLEQHRAFLREMRQKEFAATQQRFDLAISTYLQTQDTLALNEANTAIDNQRANIGLMRQTLDSLVPGTPEHQREAAMLQAETQRLFDMQRRYNEARSRRARPAPPPAGKPAPGTAPAPTETPSPGTGPQIKGIRKVR